jgi:hypothetical protein
VVGPTCGAVQLRQLLTLGAQPDEIRRAYRRCGVRFDVDAQGALTMRLDLAPRRGPLHPKNTSRTRPWRISVYVWCSVERVVCRRGDSNPHPLIGD